MNTNSDIIRLFQLRWSEVAGEYISLSSEAELFASILRYLQANSIRSAALANAPLLSGWGDYIRGSVDITIDFGKESPPRSEAVLRCSQAEAGITAVDALIADSGTLALFSRSRGDRLCSLLPETHLAVAVKAPVFPDLQSFFNSTPLDFSLSLITGPSRTADIEKQLVLGAHGPRRVVVWGPVEINENHVGLNNAHSEHS